MLLVTPGQLPAGDEYLLHIYRIECKRRSETVELTGFKIKGRNGLYTSLHGVVGGELTAISFAPESRDKGPSDKKKKIAGESPLNYTRWTSTGTLPSSSLKDRTASLPPGGLSLRARQDPAGLSGKKLHVVGYPLGVDLFPVVAKLNARNPAALKLAEQLDPNTRAYFVRRNSPNPDVKMLCIQGPLMPGFSGAPILDEDDAVIGIACGGLRECTPPITLPKGEFNLPEDREFPTTGGLVQLGWAVPFQETSDIDLRQHNGQPELEGRLEWLAARTSDLESFHAS